MEFMTIRTKIYVTVLLSGLFFIAIAFTAYHTITGLAEHFEETSRVNDQAKRYLGLVRDVEKLKRHVQSFTYTGYDDSATEAKKLYADILDILSQGAPPPQMEVDNNFHAIEVHLRRYKETFNELEKQRNSGQKLRDDIRKFAQEFEETMERYTRDTRSDSRRALAHAVETDMLVAEKGAFRYYETLDNDYVKNAKTTLKNAQSNLKKLIAAEPDAAQAARLRQLSDTLNDYTKAFVRSVQHTRGYLSLVNVVMAAEAYEVLYQADIIAKAADRVIVSIQGSVNEHITRSIQTITIAAVIFFLLMTPLSFVIIRSVVTPLGRLTRSFTELSDGRTDAPIPDYNVNDEIGALTKAAIVFQRRNVETQTLLDLSETLRRDLLSSQERLRVAAESAGIGIWDYKIQSDELVWDETMFDLYAIPGTVRRIDLAEWLARIHPEERLRVQSAFKEAIERRIPFDTLFRILCPDAPIRYIKVYAQLLYDASGEPQQLIGVNYDVTDFELLKNSLEQRVEEEVRKQREQEQVLIQQSKLASMGEMISAISHQWRQPLNAVSLYLQDLVSADKYGELDSAYLKNVVEKGMQQIQYMSNTIDDFRNFFNPGNATESLNVEMIIHDTLRLFEAQLRNNDIDSDFTFDSEAPHSLYGNANHLRQALANLLSNAVDAIKERKKQERGTDYHGRIVIDLARNANMLLITIVDNGIGIPESMLDRVFEPYFTTKQEGEGTGIGLYMTQTILQKYFHGHIRITPLPEGVSALITLPVIEPRDSEEA